MNTRARFAMRCTLIALLLLLFESTGANAYEPAGAGLRILDSGDGVTITMLVEASNLGGSEVEVGRITIPPGYESVAHAHGRSEIFYVVSGQLEHIVNGKVHLIEPGMVGLVRPGDEVVHRVTGAQACQALVIWAPGGEADRLAQRWNERPVE